MSALPTEIAGLPCRVREHPRARHVRLRMDPRQGLVVTVPAGFDRTRLPDLLKRRRDWIDAARKRQMALRQKVDPGLLGPCPQRVALPAVGQEWRVEYRRGAGRRLTLRHGPERLVLHLPGGDGAALGAQVAQSLRAWLLARGRDWLPAWTAELAAAHGFGYRCVQIRNQRSRWGSCSARGTLSLNARLLFCPPEVCRYVLIHELVHTVHPDHSERFWGRVAELVPDYRDHTAALQQTWLQLPQWV